MDRFSSLQVFIRVVDSGSFTQAARELGLGQPAVSKAVAALEARLKTQLLNRTPRGLQPTAAGQAFYASSARLLADLEEAEHQVTAGNAGPAGTVRLSLPPAFGRMFVVPRLPALLARHPGLSVELSIAEQHVDVIKDGIDVAMRIGHLRDSTLVARRIGSKHTCTVATPAYLARCGTPATPDALAHHNMIAGSSRGGTMPWVFSGPDGPLQREPTGNITANDAEAVRAAVLSGIGIAHDASALFHADIQHGRLVRILHDFAPAPLPIHAVTAGGRRTPRRVQVLIEFLAEVCASEPALGPHQPHAMGE